MNKNRKRQRTEEEEVDIAKSQSLHIERDREIRVYGMEIEAGSSTPTDNTYLGNGLVLPPEPPQSTPVFTDATANQSASVIIEDTNIENEAYLETPYAHTA